MQPDQAVRLKQGRQQAGYTQQQAADLLNVSLSAYKDWEKPNGAEPATITKMVEVITLFGISLDWWLTGTPCGPSISTREQTLISNYRRIPEEGQKGLCKLLKSYP